MLQINLFYKCFRNEVFFLLYKKNLKLIFKSEFSYSRMLFYFIYLLIKKKLNFKYEYIFYRLLSKYLKHIFLN